MNIDALINHPEWLLLVLAPLFMICMLAEYFIGQKQGRLPDNSSYKLSEVVCNFTLAGMHQLSDLLTGLLIVQLYLWLFGWRLMDIEMGVLSFIVLMILQDFFTTGSIEQVIVFAGCGPLMSRITVQNA